MFVQTCRFFLLQVVFESINFSASISLDGDFSNLKPKLVIKWPFLAIWYHFDQQKSFYTHLKWYRYYLELKTRKTPTPPLYVVYQKIDPPVTRFFNGKVSIKVSTTTKK